MQMWNVEIKNLKNEYLLKGEKECKFSKRVFTFFELFCFIPAVIIIFFGLTGEVEAETFLMVFLFVVVIGSIFFGFSLYYKKLLKECEAEIKKRLSSGELQKKDYEETFRPKSKKEKRAAIRKYAFFVISFIIILLICLGCSGLFESSSPSSYERGAGGHRKGTQAEFEYKKQNGYY